MSDTIAVEKRKRPLSFDTSAIWALIITVVAGVIVFIPFLTLPLVHTKVMVLALGTLVALALFIVSRLIRGTIILPPMTLVGAVWLVPLAYVLSTLFSGVPLEQALFGSGFETDTIGFMVLLAAIATLTALIYRRTPHYRLFSLGAFVAALIVVVIQVLFIIGAAIFPNSIGATANIVGSYSDMAMIAGILVLGSLMALRFLSLSIFSRKVVWVSLALGIFILASAGNSALWILVSLVAFALFVEGIFRRRASISSDEDLDGVTLLVEKTEGEVAPSEERPIVAPLAVLVLGLFFMVGGSTISTGFANMLGTGQMEVRPSWASTFEVGGHVYGSSPVFGSGPNTFGEKWLLARDSSVNAQNPFWNVDFITGIGFIPTSFVTTGLLGAIAWLFFIGAFLWIGIRSLVFYAPKESFVRFVSITSFAIALYVLVLMVFTVPSPVVLALGFFALGIFASSLRAMKGRQEWGIIFSNNPALGFGIVFVMTLMLLSTILVSYTLIERYIADVSYITANSKIQAGDQAGATAALSRTVSLNPTDDAYRLASILGINEMTRIANDTTLTQATAAQQFQAALTTSIQAGTQATQIDPKDYKNWVMLGRVYQSVVPLKIEGAYVSAKSAYEEAMRLNPSSPGLKLLFAQLEFSNENKEQAEVYLREALVLKNDFIDAILLLSSLQVEQGKTKEALQAAEAAAYLAPNDPSVQFQVGILRSALNDQKGAIESFARTVTLSPQNANARFYLAVMHSLEGEYEEALSELQIIAGFSEENKTAVAEDMKALENGRNPYTSARLGNLGIPNNVQVNEPAPTQAEELP